MAKSTKITLAVIGSILIIAGIACLFFGSTFNLPAAPVIGAFSAFAGAILLVVGTRKEEELPKKV